MIDYKKKLKENQVCFYSIFKEKISRVSYDKNGFQIVHPDDCPQHIRITSRWEFLNN